MFKLYHEEWLVVSNTWVGMATTNIHSPQIEIESHFAKTRTLNAGISDVTMK